MSTRTSSAHSMSNGTFHGKKENIERNHEITPSGKLPDSPNINLHQKTKMEYSDNNESLNDRGGKTWAMGLKKRTEKERGNASIMNSILPEKQVDISIYDYNEDGDSDQQSEQNSSDNVAETNNGRKCVNCQVLFENPLEMLRHSRSCQSPRKILPLKEIEKYFDSPNRNYCPICEKRIKTRNFRSVFIKHLLVHTTGLLHECNVCKKKFRRQDHMRAHQRRHIVIAPIYVG